MWCTILKTLFISDAVHAPPLNCNRAIHAIRVKDLHLLSSGSCYAMVFQEILHLEPQKTQSMLADPSVEAGTVRGKTALADEP